MTPALNHHVLSALRRSQRRIHHHAPAPASPRGPGRRVAVVLAIVVVGVLALAAAASGHAATINVNPAIGKDSNNGAATSPLKTLTRALSKVHGGDTIQLAGGNYSQSTGERYSPINGQPTVVVPSGVTIRGNAGKGLGTILFGAPNQIGLVLQGDATVSEVSAVGFGIGLQAPQGSASGASRKAMAVSVCYAGPAEDGERAIAPLRRFCEPLLERIAVIPYAVRQQLQDPSAPAGLQNYWKSDYLTGLDDDLINTVVERAADTTSPRTQIHLYQLGGAAARIGEDDSAYAHRSASYLLSIVTLWDNAESDPSPHIEWTQSFSSQLRPHAAGAYVNFLGEEGPARVRDAYGPSTYRRLAAIKAQYDPTNFFRLNHNVKPAT